MAAIVAVSPPWRTPSEARRGRTWSATAPSVHSALEKPAASAAVSAQNFVPNRALMAGCAGCLSLLQRAGARIHVHRRQQPLATDLSPPPDVAEPLLGVLPLSHRVPTMHPKQREAVDEIAQIFKEQDEEAEEPHRRVCLQGVPGSGKTLVAANVIAKLGSETDCKAALVIAPLKELTHQHHRTFRNFFHDDVSVNVFASKLRKFKRRSIEVRQSAEDPEDVNLKVVRFPSDIDEEMARERMRCLKMVSESEPCVICASTSAIFSAENLDSKGGFRLPAAERGRVVAQLEQELKQGDAPRGEECAKNCEYEKNCKARRKQTLIHMEKIREDGYCPNMLDFYGDLLELKTLFDRMNENFGENWLLVVDECHSTCPLMSCASKGYATSVRKYIEAGILREQLLPDPERRHRGGGPLPMECIEAMYPRYVLSMSATPRAEDLRGTIKVCLEHRPTNILEPVVALASLPHFLEVPEAASIPNQVTRNFRRCSRHDIRTLAGKALELIDTRQEGEQAIISCITNRQSDVLYSFLKALGRQAGVVHAGLGVDTKASVLREFREGITDVLLGTRSLIEGLDFPSVAMVIVPDADRGGMFRTAGCLKQLIGRASRNASGRAYLLHTRSQSDDMSLALLENVRAEMTTLRKKQERYNMEHGLEPVSVRSHQAWSEAHRTAAPSSRQDACIRMIAELLKTCRFKKCYQTVSEQDKAPSYFCDTLLSVEQKWVEDKWDEEQQGEEELHLKRELQMAAQDLLAEQDSEILLEQIALMITAKLIGVVRVYRLMKKFKSIDKIIDGTLDQVDFESIESIGVGLSRYLMDSEFRKALVEMRDKLRMVCHLGTAILDHQIIVAEGVFETAGGMEEQVHGPDSSAQAMANPSVHHREPPPVDKDVRAKVDEVLDAAKDDASKLVRFLTWRLLKLIYHNCSKRLPPPPDEGAF